MSLQRCSHLFLAPRVPRALLRRRTSTSLSGSFPRPSKPMVPQILPNSSFIHWRLYSETNSPLEPSSEPLPLAVEVPPLSLPSPEELRKVDLPLPMKLETLDIESAERLFISDEWVCEQKVDGIRCTITVTPKAQHTFGSGNGTALSSSVAGPYFPVLAKTLPPSDVDYTLDGEIMWTGDYYVFDILKSDDKELLEMTLEERRFILEELFEKLGLHSPIHLLPQARTSEEKRVLYKKIEAMGGEGVVFKHRKGKYKPGFRSRDQLKIKFRKTVDCIVTARNIGKQTNAILGLFDTKGRMRQIGRCSMIGKEDAKRGDVVEVAYLYATEALKLYQPAFVKIRTDKPAKQCTLDQLVPVNKRVLHQNEL